MIDTRNSLINIKKKLILSIKDNCGKFRKIHSEDLKDIVKRGISGPRNMKRKDRKNKKSKFYQNALLDHNIKATEEEVSREQATVEAALAENQAQHYTSRLRR